MANLGSFSRTLLARATAVYYGGVPVSLMDAQGNVILGDDLPAAPTVTSTIADRTYTIGDTAATVDLRTKFDGATSYTISPTNPAVSITDYTLTINPTAAMAQTTFTVRGINGGGASAEAVTFKLTVNAPTPVLLKPFPDQSLLIGGGTVTLPLSEYFSGATAFAVSPANQGVTIANGNLIISRTTARDVVVTVTATNATGQDTADSFALAIGAAPNQAPGVTGPIPAQAPVANVAFTVNLASYFSDPDGDPLLFDYTGTLPTGISRNGAVFAGTATVTGQTASGVLRARDPGNLEVDAPVTWAVATQPALTAPTPATVTQNQQTIIAFNVLPDSVTVIQAGQSLPAARIGGTNNYMFVPFTADPVAISALKAGYTPFNATWTVTNAAPDTIATADNYIAFTNVDETSASFPVTINTAPYNTGARTAAPAGLADGPVFLVNPTQTGNATVGAVHTGDPGAILTLGDPDEVTITYRWLRGSTAISGATLLTYTSVDADKGATLKFEVAATDSRGTRVFATTGVAIPATMLPDAPAAARTDIAGQTYQSGEVWAKLGGTGTIQVSDTSGLFRFAPNGTAFYYRGAANRGANQYAKATWWKAGSVSGLSPVVQLQLNGANTNRHQLRTENGNLLLQSAIDGVITTHATIPTAGLPASCDLELELINGTTLRAYANGSQIAEKALSGAFLLTGGGTGLLSVGTSTTQNTMTNFEARATR